MNAAYTALTSLALMQGYQIDTNGIEQFVSGFIFGFIGKDDLPDI